MRTPFQFIGARHDPTCKQGICRLCDAMESYAEDQAEDQKRGY